MMHDQPAAVVRRQSSNRTQSFATSGINNMRKPTLSRHMRLIKHIASVCLAMCIIFDQASAVAQVLPKSAERLYVPIDQFQSVLYRDKLGVLLDSDEFEALWKQAQKNQASAPANSADLVMTGVEYVAEVDEHSLLITAKVDLRQFTEGWRSIPLRFNNIAIEGAEVDGNPARIGRDSQGELRFFHNKTGKIQLTLNLVARLGTIGSDQLVAFNLLAGPAATMSVKIPAGKHLLLGGRALERPAPVENEATYSFPVGNGKDLTFKITDKQKEATTDSLVFANSLIGVDAVPGEVRWRSMTRLQLYGQSLSQILLNVPAELEIADVISGGLDSWDMNEDPDDEDQTLLTLNYRQPMTGSQTIELRGVLSMPPDEEWPVPQLAIKNIDSHVGHLILTHPAAVRLQFVTQEGLRRAKLFAQEQMPKFVSEIPDRVSPQVFEFYRQSFTLELLMRTRDRELVANIQNLLELNYETIQYHAEITLVCRYAPLFELQMELPAEWLPTSVTINGQPQEWEDDSEAAGTRQLKIKLAQPLMPGQELKAGLIAVRELDDWPPTIDPEEDATEIELPQLILPEADLFDGRYLLSSHSDFEVRPIELFSLNRVLLADNEKRLAYDYQDAVFSALFELRRRPTQLSAQMLSFVRKDPRALRSYLQADVSIEGSGIRELSFILPESVGTNVRFTTFGGPQRIVEQVPSAPEAGNINWKLTFDRRLYGTISVAVQTTEVVDEESSIFAPRLLLNNAERQYGYIAVEAGPEQNLTVTPSSLTATPLREIDPSEIPISNLNYQPQERIVATYEFVTPEYSVELASERFDRTPVPPAVVEELKIASIVSESGTWQHEAVAQFSSAGVQNLLVQLPANSTLWSATLDGSPIEVRGMKDHFLIPLVNSSAETTLRNLKLVYISHSEPLGSSGKLEQSPPQLSLEIDGQKQPMEILQSQWSVYTPRNLDLVESTGIYQSGTTFDADSLVARFLESTESISQSRLLGVSLVTGLLTGFIWLILRVRSKGLGATILTIASVLVITVSFLSVLISPSFVGHQPSGGAVDYGQAAPSTSGEMSVDMKATGDFSADFDDIAEGLSVPTQESDRRLSEFESEGSAPAEGEEAPPTSKPAAPQAPARQQGVDEFMAEGLVAEEGEAIDQTIAGKKVSGARLSVDVALEIPDDHRELMFQYYGTQSDFSESPLKLRYLRRQSASGRMVLVISLALIVFYVLRKRPVSRRILLHGLTLTVPLAIMPFWPAYGLFILDGIVVASLIASAVWLMTCCWSCCCQPLLCRLAQCCQPKTVTTSALLLFAFSGSIETSAAPPTAAVPTAQQVTQPPAPPIAPLDWTVIVPYKPGDDPLAAEKVFLNRRQYLELWNRAHPEEPIGESLPGETSVSTAAFLAEVEGEGDSASIKVTARFVFQSFANGLHKATVPLSRVALESALLNEEPVSLMPFQTKEGSGYKINLTEKGQHQLDLVFRLPYQQAGTGGRFTLPLTNATIGRLTVKLPADDLMVQVNGTTTAYRRVTENDQDSILLPLASNGDITIAWSPSREEAGFDRIVHVDTTSALSAGDAGLNLIQTADYSVPQGSIEEALFQLPAGWELQSISGLDVGGWEVNEEGDKRLLRIFLRRKVDSETKIVFELFQAVEFEDVPFELEYPHLTPMQVTGEKGLIGLFAEEQLRIRPGTFNLLSQLETSQFPAANRKPILKENLHYAFRFARTDYELPVTIVRKDPAATAETHHGLMVQPARIQVASKHRIDLASTPRSRVSILLPENYVLLDVQATELQDWYQTYSADDDRLLIVEFPRVLSGKLEIALQGYLRKEPMDEIAEIILPTLLEMSQDKTHMAIWGIGSDRLSLDEADGWNPVNPRELPPELLKLQKKLPDFSFEATQILDRYLALLIQKVKPQLKADTVVIVNVTDSAVIYQLAIKWDISQSTTDRFVFTTPESLAGKLNFTDAPFLQSYTSEVTDDGRIRWKVYLTQPQSQGYFLSPIATLPLPSDGVLTVPQMSVEQFPHGFEEEEFSRLDRQRHYVALVNQSQFQLTAQDDSMIERIQQSELPINPEGTLVEKATELFRVRAEKTPPSWTLRSYEQKRGAAAIINFTELITVLEQDGSWRTKASYLIRNSNRQFLALKIPQNSRLLAAIVQEQPVRPVVTKLDETPVTLLPLPKTTESDLSFFVEIILAGRLPEGNLVKGLKSWAEEIDLPAPSVVTTRESTQFGIPVTRTAWTVWLPESLQAEEVDDLNRTNLSPQESVEALVDLQVAQLKEINLMLSSTDSEQQAALQKKLLYNVDKLNRRIEMQQAKEEKYLSFSRQKSLSKGKLVEEQRALEDNRRRLERSYEQQQQAIQEDRYEYLLENFKSLDAQSQGGVVISGNSILNMNNGFVDQNGNGNIESNDQFYFGLQQQPNESAEKQDAKTKQPAAPQQQLKKRLSNEPASGRRSSGQSGQQTPPLDGLNLLQNNDPFGRNGQNQSGGRFMNGSNAGDDFAGQSRTRGFRFSGQGGGGGFGGVGMGENRQSPNVNLGILNATQEEFKLGEIEPHSAEVAALETQSELETTSHNTGMSLKFDIPTFGKPLTFSKVGGEPRLALEIKPEDSFSGGRRLIWVLLWILVSVGLFQGVTSGRWMRCSVREIGLSVAAIAFLFCLVIPIQFVPIAFLVMLSGLLPSFLGVKKSQTPQE